jgi:hypothetical protein
MMLDSPHTSAQMLIRSNTASCLAALFGRLVHQVSALALYLGFVLEQRLISLLDVAREVFPALLVLIPRDL